MDFFFFWQLLSPQATGSDKNYLQARVTKSPFPLKGPSNLKVLCMLCFHSSEPSPRQASVSTESKGGHWVSRDRMRTGLREEGLVPPFRFSFFLIHQAYPGTVHTTFLEYIWAQKRKPRSLHCTTNHLAPIHHRTHTHRQACIQSLHSACGLHNHGLSSHVAPMSTRFHRSRGASTH